MAHFVAYITTAFVFLCLDIIWLGGIAKDFYFGRLDGLVRENPDLGVAAIFYTGYIGGIVFFAVSPALKSGRLSQAIINGAFLGLFAYGTYDATNLSTLKGWPTDLAIVDTLWGGFLTSVAAASAFLAAQRFHR